MCRGTELNMEQALPPLKYSLLADTVLGRGTPTRSTVAMTFQAASYSLQEE